MQFKKLVAAVSGAVFLMAGQLALADSTNDLVDALVSKGVLTEEEGKLLTKGHKGEIESEKKKRDKDWTSHINVRGYVQNRVTPFQSGDEGTVLWPDPSVGDDTSGAGRGQTFRIRRARIIFSGKVGDHLDFYIQPDFASTSGDTGNITQLRDAYGDINITKNKVHRIRVGQSKVPFGYENLQSSSNRLSLDRVDALNSAVRDERDTGMFYYYTPETVQELFKEISDKNLKHSGNYGMFGAGIYMGQGANNNDLNDNWHRVVRFTYPWKTDSGQIYEAGIQGYKGRFVRTSTAIRSATGATLTPTVDTLDRFQGSTTTGEFNDERAAVSFRMYPQPWGLEGEWTWGTTPGYDLSDNKVANRSLHGGYIQGSYYAQDVSLFNTNIGLLIPFLKWQYYDGYNKAETNAPQNRVNDWELGVEWQIAPEVELAAVYHRMKRTNMTREGAYNTLVGSYQEFEAEALRLQLQYNFF